MPEAEIDSRGNIIRAVNEQFGNIQWKDGGKIRQVIAEELDGVRPLDAREGLVDPVGDGADLTLRGARADDEVVGEARHAAHV